MQGKLDNDMALIVHTKAYGFLMRSTTVIFARENMPGFLPADIGLVLAALSAVRSHLSASTSITIRGTLKHP